MPKIKKYSDMLIAEYESARRDLNSFYGKRA